MGIAFDKLPEHLQRMIRDQRQARATTAPVEREPQSAGDVLFLLACRSAGLPVPVAEHRFHPTRRWRFDYAWLAAKVALEVEGGVWTGGRHTRGKGFIGDLAKYNAATVLGWRILRVTPDQLKTSVTIEMIRGLVGVAE